MPVKRAITRRPEVTGSLLTGGPKMPQMAHFDHLNLANLGPNGHLIRIQRTQISKEQQ